MAFWVDWSEPEKGNNLQPPPSNTQLLSFPSGSQKKKKKDEASPSSHFSQEELTDFIKKSDFIFSCFVITIIILILTLNKFPLLILLFSLFFLSQSPFS
jgi:hypothetical protein